MSEQEKHQELDQLLDSLLAQYSDVEPSIGLENRLIANLRRATAPKTTDRHIWRWLLTGAGVAAVAVAVLVIYVSQMPQLLELPAIQVAGIPALPVTTSATSRPAGYSGHLHHKSHLAKAEDIRQEVFPTPTTPSQGERLLFRYLAATPKEQIAALSSRNGETAEWTEPLGVQPRKFTGTDEQNIR